MPRLQGKEKPMHISRGCKEDIYIQDPTKKIDMAFPLWLWQRLKLLKRVGILRQNPNATFNVKTKGRLKRNARLLKCVEVLRHNLNANLNVKNKGSLKRNARFLKGVEVLR